MTGRGLLLAELERIARSCCRLGRLAQPGDLEQRPRDGMRSLLELGNLMGSALLVELRTISGAQQDEIRELEDGLWSDVPDDWCAQLRDGYEQLRHYMESLSFDQFENNSCTAYYGRTQTNAKWLLEMLTQLVHHRAQLFTCLKLLGYDIDPRILTD